MLGHWTRRLADGGLVAALTATSPRRLGHPDGGPKLTGTNPLAIAIPSSDGRPVVADVSMGNLTYGDVLAGRASEDDLAPFGGEQAHKAFALAVGLQLLVDALTPDDGFGAVLLVARPESDPVPAFRALAGRRAAAGRSLILGRVSFPCRCKLSPSAACRARASRRRRRRARPRTSTICRLAPLRMRSIARCTGQTTLSSGRRSARFSSASGSPSSPSHAPPRSRRTTSPT